MLENRSPARPLCKVASQSGEQSGEPPLPSWTPGAAAAPAGHPPAPNRSIPSRSSLPARPARAAPGAGLAKWRTRCGRCGGLRAIPGRSARCTRTLATSPTPGASRRAPRSRATAHSRTARGAATTAPACSRIFDGLRGRRRAPSGRRARRPRTRGAACPSSRARGGRCVLTAHRGGERRKRRQRRRPSRPIASGPRVRRRGRRRRRGAATAATVLPPPPRHRRRAAAARHQRRPSPTPLVFQPRGGASQHNSASRASLSSRRALF